MISRFGKKFCFVSLGKAQNQDKAFWLERQSRESPMKWQLEGKAAEPADKRSQWQMGVRGEMLKSIQTGSSVRCLPALSPLCPWQGNKVGLHLESKEWFCRTKMNNSQRALQPLDAQGYTAWFSCCSINASSPPFSGDHTSWGLPGSGVKKQESHQRSKFTFYIRKQPQDALSSAGNFVCHKVKPGWCFLNSKSHLVTNSQRY